MATQEIYEAMQRKVIDGYENVMASADQSKQGEVTNTVFLLYSGMTNVSYAMNRKSFDSLPADLQRIVVGPLREEFSDRAAKQLKEAELRLIEKWKSSGVRFVKPSEAELKRVKETAVTATAEAIKKQEAAINAPGKGQALWSQYQSLVQKYEKIVAEKGYPWKPK